MSTKEFKFRVAPDFVASPCGQYMTIEENRLQVYIKSPCPLVPSQPVGWIDVTEYTGYQLSTLLQRLEEEV